ncbi:hypothetical protein ACFPLB_10090 [Aquamicrobium segne]|uniref:Uncharacterized protein n=1 Tax=Aquamicrobium segne TaxID=469547 RepID=A0ABW0GXC1_9HYPH
MVETANREQLRSSGSFFTFRLKPGEDLLAGLRAAFIGLNSDASAIVT